MRNIRLKVPLFLGDRYRAVGDTLPIEDDRAAKRIVDLGHAEFVALVQQATAPPPPDTAKAPVPAATAPPRPENAKAK